MAALAPHPQASRDLEIGYGQALGWGTKPALLVIDVCRAYWQTGSPLDLLHNPAAAASLDSMRRLVAAARTGGIPIIWAQVRYNSGTMLDGGIQYKKAPNVSIWQDGDDRGMGELMPGLGPGEGESVLYKKNPSCFFGTALSTELVLRGVDTLVLCGVSTSGCVRASAVDAMCHGFRPMIVPSACGDRSPMIQDATLFDLNAMYADIVLEDDAIEKMSIGWP